MWNHREIICSTKCVGVIQGPTVPHRTQQCSGQKSGLHRSLVTIKSSCSLFHFLGMVSLLTFFCTAFSLNPDYRHRYTLGRVINWFTSKLTAVFLTEDKIIITYYHFLDVLLIHPLIKLLKLACTVLAFPNNALTNNNSACRLILKRNNHSTTYFSIVIHGWVVITPPTRIQESTIPFRDLFTVTVPGQRQSRSPRPWSLDPKKIETSGSRWKVGSSQHYLQRLLSQRFFSSCSETVIERTLEPVPGVFDSGSKFGFTQRVEPSVPPGAPGPANPGVRDWLEGESVFSTLPESPVAPSS